MLPLTVAMVMPLIALTACGAVDGACGPTTGRVARVRDGDTVELVDGEVIRYLAVDTPERDACYGAEARVANASLVTGKELSLEDDVRCRDVYERRLAYVAVGGRDVGIWLVEHGFARADVIPPNDARELEYREAAETARAAGRGLWSACR